jgi:excisionase family DNA binding protein
MADHDAQAVHDLLTPAEVARRVRVSESTVRRLVARGELEGIRFGKAIRIPADALGVRQRMSPQRQQPSIHAGYERKSDQRL